MKQKQIIEFVQGIVEICAKKVVEARKNNLPDTIMQYEAGRLYEACYILEEIEKIIYKD